jgi:hypothetical protein
MILILIICGCPFLCTPDYYVEDFFVAKAAVIGAPMSH